jgi:hypothetical protein
MADETRNGDSKVRVVRLLGHRDDAGAWEIRDFLKRSVVESQWIGLDPRVHRFFAITLSRPCPAKGMDARDKPVHDNLMRLAQVENARRSVPATQVRAVRGVGKWVA